MPDWTVFLIVGGVLLLAWPVLRLGLLRRVSPLRLELAEKGEALLRDPGLDPVRRRTLSWMLDHAFSPWAFYTQTLFGIFPLPRRFVDGMPPLSPELAERWRLVDRLHTVSLAVAAPFAAPVLLSASWIVGRLVRSLNAPVADSKTAAAALWSGAARARASLRAVFRPGAA